MAETHKIPQNVTFYQGRIIGNFTAKQFVFLAIGAVAAFLIATSALSIQLKVVLIVVIALISLLFSLATVQGRTTDVWIQNFLQAVRYSTQMVWRKHEFPPEFLLPGYHIERTKTGPRKRTIKELEKFIQLWQPTRAEQEFSKEERTILARVQAQTQSKISTPPIEKENQESSQEKQ